MQGQFATVSMDKIASGLISYTLLHHYKIRLWLQTGLSTLKSHPSHSTRILCTTREKTMFCRTAAQLSYHFKNCNEHKNTKNIIYSLGPPGAQKEMEEGSRLCCIRHIGLHYC